MSEIDPVSVELQRERETRAILEARLARAEGRLRDMERVQTQAARQDVESVRIQQTLWSAPTGQHKVAEGPALSTWLIEARMSAVDVATQAAPVHVRPQPVPLMASAAFASASNSASVAYIQRSEEVNRLRRELDQTRTSEKRALERLREMELRVAGIESHAAKLRMAAEAPAQPMAWAPEPLSQVPSAVAEQGTLPTDPAVEAYPEEEAVAEISGALAVPELERRVQSEPPLPDAARDARQEEAAWHDAETVVALRTFARALQDRPETDASLVADEEPFIPEMETVPAQDSGAQGEEPEDGLDAPETAPESGLEVLTPEQAREVPEVSAFSDMIKAWGAREAGLAVPAHEPDEEESEAEADTEPSAGGPRPDDRTEVMVEALQRLMGKKSE